MFENPNYEERWTDLRLRIRIFWTTVLLAPGICLGLLVFMSLLPGERETNEHDIWIGVIWLITLGAAVFYRSSFRCPRCNELFFMKWYYGNFWARRCMHCKLPLWQTPLTQQSTE